MHARVADHHPQTTFHTVSEGEFSEVRRHKPIDISYGRCAPLAFGASWSQWKAIRPHIREAARKGGDRCYAVVHGPSQGGRRADRRGGGRCPQEGRRDPGRVRGQVPQVLVQRGYGRGLLPSGRPEQGGGRGRTPRGAWSDGGRDN